MSPLLPHAARHAVAALIACVLSGGSLPGCAAPLYSGTASASWQSAALVGNLIARDGNVVALDNSAGAVFSGIGFDRLTWGDYRADLPPLPSGVSASSSLKFTGTPFIGIASGSDVFRLGILQFTNGTSISSTLAFGGDILLDIGLPIDPLLLHVVVTATENTGIDPAFDADFLELAGLGLPTVHAYEGATASVDLFARIADDRRIEITGFGPPVNGFLGNGPLAPPALPVPPTGVLVAAGLAVLAFLRWRRQGVSA